MAVVSRFASIRRRFCLALVIGQALCGIIICTVGGLELGWIPNGPCGDHNSAAFVTGSLLCLAGSCGMVAYVYYVVGKGKLSIDLFRTLLLIYVVLTVSVVMPMVVQTRLGQCVIDFRAFAAIGEEPLALLTIKLVTTYTSFVISVLALAFVAPDIAVPTLTPHTTSPGNILASRNSLPVSERVEVAPLPVKVDVESQTLTKKAPPLQLPEAKTHIQEAAGCGEKVTVVTLPEAEGVIYAVPEQSYVIRRGEATYVAPAGNKRLTLFFPTYTKMDTE